ncbi:MAG TPA: ABC transporter permease, partial [Vicinamibacteria bacterium]
MCDQLSPVLGRLRRRRGHRLADGNDLFGGEVRIQRRILDELLLDPLERTEAPGRIDVLRVRLPVRQFPRDPQLVRIRRRERGPADPVLVLDLLVGGVDLSPGAVIALASVVSGRLFVEAGCSIWASLAAGLLVGVGSGLFTAVLVVLAGLPPFIATLGTMGIARGTAFIVTEGRFFDVSGSLRPGWQPLGVPLEWLAPLAMVVLGAVFQILMHGFQWGRGVYAVGGNETAAHYSGIPVGAVKTLVYLLAGVLAAIAGLVLVLVQGQGKADLATGYELDIIASAVVGGASLSGGRGSVLGAVLGTLIFGVLRNALPQIPGA